MRRAKNSAIQMHTRLIEFFVEVWRLSKADMLAQDLAVRTDPTLFECEQRLREDHIPFHAIHFDYGSDATTTIAEARLLNDDVHSRSDLFANSTNRQIHTRHQHHHLES